MYAEDGMTLIFDKSDNEDVIGAELIDDEYGYVFTPQQDYPTGNAKYLVKKPLNFHKENFKTKMSQFEGNSDKIPVVDKKPNGRSKLNLGAKPRMVQKTVDL